MKKKELFFIPLVTLVTLMSLGACADESSEYIIYGNHENMSETSKDYLINCLDDRGIEFKLDAQKNILIQKRDNDMAVASCS
ncbi:hypothetical protein DVB69_15940 [Sporosarcina sp. BI001-red]|uniref:hypothetical protein n=1 Tax=Sporosarcina sp. BI001-red TaxID=2282866 RepID=UPI000E25F23E|nr:hypothetical protein [Sporosarcina sp. BI001-red]REB05244.1 hypothetical protein DVB69_15940 [Sporosarcina sp. BI001-red]